MPRHPEHQLQVSVVRYLRLLPGDILFCGTPAGSLRQNARQGARMKAAGYRAGWPDLLILEPRGEYHGLAIELKVKGGRVSPAQRQVLADMRDRGYRAEATVGFSATKAVIDGYFGMGVIRPPGRREIGAGTGPSDAATSSLGPSPEIAVTTNLLVDDSAGLGA